MRLLLFSDLHNNASAANDIVRDSDRVDVVIGAGDFCNMHRGLDAAIAILSRIDRPTILVPGNAETTDELLGACANWPNAHILHGTAVTIEGIPFFGIGGGIPVTPFGSWSYDFSEDAAEQLLKPCPPGCVFVSHSPPKDVVDASSTRKGLGSCGDSRGDPSFSSAPCRVWPHSRQRRTRRDARQHRRRERRAEVSEDLRAGSVARWKLGRALGGKTLARSASEDDVTLDARRSKPQLAENDAQPVRTRVTHGCRPSCATDSRCRRSRAVYTANAARHPSRRGR